VRGGSPGNQYLRITRHPDFRRVRSGYLVPREGVGEPETRVGKVYRGVKRFLFGRPLASAEEASERVSRPIGLALFASDNISSSAYATEEIMRVLILAGVGAIALTMPISLAIVVVMAIVVFSYREVIRAYPDGGGSYIVAKDNLGPLAGLTAGAALLTDYTLTVAVSTAAGITAITSAFPELFPHRVPIMVGVVAFVMVMNLRGIRESGRAFAIPTYVYVVSILGHRHTPDLHAPRRVAGNGGTWCRGARAVADSSRVCLRLGSADRHRGDFERCDRVQATGGA
jgi:hypothetical protein